MELIAVLQETFRLTKLANPRRFLGIYLSTELQSPSESSQQSPIPKAKKAARISWLRCPPSRVFKATLICLSLKPLRSRKTGFWFGRPPQDVQACALNP
jgi:hypothetical protein